MIHNNNNDNKIKNNNNNNYSIDVFAFYHASFTKLEEKDVFHVSAGKQKGIAEEQVPWKKYQLEYKYSSVCFRSA